MAGEITLTVVGNLTADPELRYTQSGLPVANFTIASSARTFDRAANEWKDGETTFLRCTVWRKLAENVAATLRKGHNVIAMGNLSQRDYEVEGQKRRTYELDVSTVGPSLTFATAAVTRTSASTPSTPAGEPWSAPVGAPAAGDGFIPPAEWNEVSEDPAFAR